MLEVVQQQEIPTASRDSGSCGSSRGICHTCSRAQAGLRAAPRRHIAPHCLQVTRRYTRGKLIKEKEGNREEEQDRGWRGMGERDGGEGWGKRDGGRGRGGREN